MFCGFSYTQNNFFADTTFGCDSVMVKFTHNIDTTTIDSLTWNFDMGYSIKSFDPDVVNFNRPGEYTVNLFIDNDPIPISRTINVYKTLNTEFIYDYAVQEFEYDFIAVDTIPNSTGTYTYEWTFTDTDSAIINSENITVTLSNQSAANVRYAFPAEGSYMVGLKISDSYGCSDSYSQSINVIERPTEFAVGNVFYPESNPYFVINPRNSSVVLSFKVFSRTGVKVFDAEAPVIYWDGKTNSGLELSPGVYFYILEAPQGEPTGDYYTKKGFIHLFRE